MKKLIVLTIGFVVAAGTALNAADAKTNWEKQCAKCHGENGKGDTKMGQKLKVEDYTDPAIQAKMKDEEMAKRIKEGVKEDGKTKMKAYGDMFTDEEIKALVAYIRGFKK